MEVTMEYHNPALLQESVDGLAMVADGRYVDVTFGGGGHSKEILKRLSLNGRLFAFDQDPDAEQNRLEDDRFSLINQNFSFLKNFLRMYNVIPVDGVLADLGVSFHQFDVPQRGFSFRFSGPLDMRMDQKRKITAAKVVNTYATEDLERIFKEYGELRVAKQVVQRIENARSEKKITTVEELKALLKNMVPEKVEHKFLAQVFQALRIEVNEELKVIQDLLEQAVEVLKEGGRMSVITYHSLEDRLVKNFFKTGNVEGKVEKDFYGNLIRPMEPVNRKPIVPSEEEVKRNNRSRSAKLRIAEKVNVG
ncbi:MAG: 16S rRNA (cytosine(1402)-N(4))-methyltransferase RsmH [Flavobacteriales bacterium]|nr:16S rRNA (cytosine(1402)-N(4))-methyltransferase RsmH [Flavobacteriales bacterium]